jgi:hypothetical protein
MLRIFCLAKELLDWQRGFCSMELLSLYILHWETCQTTQTFKDFENKRADTHACAHTPLSEQALHE